MFLLSKITIPFGAKELTLDPLILSLGQVFQERADLRFAISEIALDLLFPRLEIPAHDLDYPSPLPSPPGALTLLSDGDQR